MKKISIPSKTFLLGEYLALYGKGALVVSTTPRFEMEVRPGNASPFHPESPAGVLWQENQERCRSLEWKWHDPHHGAGGFGASTAQFIALCKYLNLEHSAGQEYQRINQKINPSAFQPSGADLQGQIHGGLTHWNGERKEVEHFSWPFADLSWALLKTSHKISTHEHLRTLKNFEFQHLEKIFNLCLRSLREKSQLDFVRAINEYAKELERLGFVAESTRDILKSISYSSIIAKKGCGALGADVILILYPHLQRDEVRSYIKGLGRLQWVADERDVTFGVTEMAITEEL